MKSKCALGATLGTILFLGLGAAVVFIEPLAYIFIAVLVAAFIVMIWNLLYSLCADR